MKKAILGTKLGMLQIFDETGRVIPVTVVKAGPCVVTQIKTMENDGYKAIQVGYEDIRKKHLTKPMEGHFTKHGVSPSRRLREFRMDDVGSYALGQEIRADIFDSGEVVDVTGITKGKGFQGAIKRHGFHR